MFKLRKLLCLALSVALLAAFAACGRNPPASVQNNTSGSARAASAGGTEPSPGDVSGEITWLMRSSPFENEWEQEVVIPAFKEMYPNVSVNMIIVAQDQIDAKLLSMQAAGTPPDIFSMWSNSGFMDYHGKGLLMDLTDYIARDINKDDFIDGIFEIYAVDGRYYHMPQVSNFSMMMVYNKTLFREAGLEDLPYEWNDPDWTWDTMVEYAKQLTKGEGADKQYGIFFDPGFPDHVIRQFGLDPFPAEAYETGVMDKTNFDDPKVVDVLQKWADLIHVDGVHPTPVATELLQQMGHIFATGKIGMATILPTQAYGNFKDVEFEWGLAPFPAGAPGSATGALFNGAYFISSGTKSPEAAWALLKFLSTPESAEQMREVTGFLVPLKETAESWFQQMADATSSSVEDIKTAIAGYPKETSRENINHIFSGYYELSDTFEQGLDPLWLGSATAQQAVDGMIEGLNETAAKIKADVELQR